MKIHHFKNKDFKLIAIISLAVIAVFLISVNYPILDNWDDQFYILDNEHLALNLENLIFFITKPYYHMYTPITMYSYMFDFNIWGYNAVGYHIQNMFWHLIACIFVYKIFRLFNINAYIVFFAVLIFSIHPQRVESVVWLSERKDVLCAAFYFASIYYYIKRSRRNEQFSISAFILYLLAFLSKPMAMSIPFVLLFYEFYKNRHFKIKYYLKRLWMYFLILIVFVLMAFKYQAIADEKFNLLKQVYIVLYNIIWYIRKTLFPLNLNPIYSKTDIPASFIYLICIYVLIIGVMIFLFIKSKKNFIYIYVPIILCYLISLAPVSGFVSWGSFDKADRWSYIPSVFVWFLIIVLFSRYIYKIKNGASKKILNNRTLSVIISFYILFLIVSNIIYQQNWQNAYSIFYRASIFTPANEYALWNLAKTEIKNRRYLNALKLEKQIRMSDNLACSYRADYIAGSCYFEMRDYWKAVDALKKISNVKPVYALKILDSKKNKTYDKMLTILAVSYMKLGKSKLAVEYFNKIIIHNINNPSIKFYYSGMICLVEKNYDKALIFFVKAGDLDPNNKIIERRIKETQMKLL